MARSSSSLARRVRSTTPTTRPESSARLAAPVPPSLAGRSRPRGFTSESRSRPEKGDTMSKLFVPPISEVELPSWAQLGEILGYDKGFNEEADAITQSADGADLNRMWREFRAAVGLLNKHRTPLVGLLTYPVSDPTERVLLPVADDFEEASEYGEPKGIRLGPPFIAGYDFKWYDIAIRYTLRFLAESSEQQISALNASALDADVRLQFVRVLRSIFNNVNSTATVNDQNVNVYRLWNADGNVPPSYNGTTFAGSHT